MYVSYRVYTGLLIIGAFITMFGCGPSRNKPTLEFVPHMMDSPAVKAQHEGPFQEPMRTPPEGTVPVHFQPYRYANDPEGAAKNLRNPFSRSKEMLLQGQKLYNTFCIVCHGSRGEGDGTVVPKFPRPPTLNSDKVRNWPDGRIFHVITAGQNLMPSYSSQLNASERWAVVHYVRVLQRAAHPTAADLQAVKK